MLKRAVLIGLGEGLVKFFDGTGKVFLVCIMNFGRAESDGEEQKESLVNIRFRTYLVAWMSAGKDGVGEGGK